MAFWSELLRTSVEPTVVADALASSALSKEARRILCATIGRLVELTQHNAERQRKLESMLGVIGAATAHAAEAADGSGKDDSRAVDSLLVGLASAAPSAATLVAASVVEALMRQVELHNAPSTVVSLLASIVQTFPELGKLRHQPHSRGDSGAANSSGLQRHPGFSTESILERMADSAQRPDELAPLCALLASCLPQSSNPAELFAAAIQQLSGLRQFAAAAELVNGAVAGFHNAANLRSEQLDNACWALGRSLSALAPIEGVSAAQVVQLLLLGSGGKSLLTERGQAGVLQQLVSAAEAAELEHAVVAQILHAAALALSSHALATTQEVVNATLNLLGLAFRVMLRESCAAVSQDELHSDGDASDGERQQPELLR